MAVRSKGIRSKSRQILRKSPRKRGAPPPSHALREFPEGSSVAIVIDSAVHGGMPHIRFQGTTGVVLGRQGESIVVAIRAGNKPKHLVVRPEHLKPVR
jgi:large subunit ribosomal protein L21e